MPSIFGPLIAPWNVEQAVLTTLRDRLPAYLVEIERQNGLEIDTLPRPPADDSYYGGEDFNSWEQDDLPALIVTCNPTGQPEFDRDAGYGQLYEIEIGAVIVGQDEDGARMLAGLYAAAVMGAVGQHGDLGGISDRTRLVMAPTVRFPDPDRRQIANGVTAFHVFVQPIFTEDGGPVVLPTPPESEPLPVPTVSKTETDLTAEPLT